MDKSLVLRGVGTVFSALSKTTGVLLIVASLLLSLSVGVATSTVGTVSNFFGIVSDSIGLSSKVARYSQADLDRVVAESQQQLRELNDSHDRTLSRLDSEHRAQIEIRSQRIDRLAAENQELRAAATVTYRGERRLAREVVTDTTDRIRQRATFAAGRNIASMPGEAIPFVGITVVAGATAWEVKDACSMMEDLYEMEVAFDPTAAVPADDTELCGLRVPTRAEVAAMIRESRGAIWLKMNELYGELPELPDLDGIIDQFSTAWNGWIGTNGNE